MLELLLDDYLGAGLARASNGVVGGQSASLPFVGLYWAVTLGDKLVFVPGTILPDDLSEGLEPAQLLTSCFRCLRARS